MAPTETLQQMITSRNRSLYAEYRQCDKRLKPTNAYTSTQPAPRKTLLNRTFDATIYEKIGAEDNRTEAFAPIDLLPDDVVSQVAQRDSSNIPCPQRGSATFILRNIDLMQD